MSGVSVESGARGGTPAPLPPRTGTDSLAAGAIRRERARRYESSPRVSLACEGFEQSSEGRLPSVRGHTPEADHARQRPRRKPGNGDVRPIACPTHLTAWHFATVTRPESGTRRGRPTTDGPASTASGGLRPRAPPGRPTNCSWPTSGTTARRCRPPSGTGTGRGVRAVAAAGSGTGRRTHPSKSPSPLCSVSAGSITRGSSLPGSLTVRPTG